MNHPTPSEKFLGRALGAAWIVLLAILVSTADAKADAPGAATCIDPPQTQHDEGSPEVDLHRWRRDLATDTRC